LNKVEEEKREKRNKNINNNNCPTIKEINIQNKLLFNLIIKKK
jgi:hypothetical protein